MNYFSAMKKFFHPLQTVIESDRAIFVFTCGKMWMWTSLCHAKNYSLRTRILQVLITFIGKWATKLPLCLHCVDSPSIRRCYSKEKTTKTKISRQRVRWTKTHDALDFTVKHGNSLMVFEIHNYEFMEVIKFSLDAGHNWRAASAACAAWSSPCVRCYCCGRKF